MRFSNIYYIFFLLVLPLFVSLVVWQFRQQRRARAQLADQLMQERLLPKRSRWRKKLQRLLLLLVLFFGTLALMNPQWGFHEEEVSRRGVNVMLLVDVSDSMLAQDVTPSRMEVAKRKLIDLVQMLAGDRVGLIAFAGRSFLLSPLTIDYGSLHTYIEEMSTETIPVQGTDLAGAIRLALKSFPPQEDQMAKSARTIMIFTDGEDHSEQMKEVVEQLKKEKVALYILGIGTPEGAPVPEPEGGFKTTARGEQVVSHLAEGFLKDLAVETGGVYVRAVRSDQDLEELYTKGIRSDVEAQEMKWSTKKLWESRFYWPLSIALGLFFLSQVFLLNFRSRHRV